ncbi:MAG: hypothetical protein GX576_00235 [Thauera phenolivorans]|uniref:Uncharacterized protein n=1 Tax=Thauera phenolivorans TaxID=1792543 RepID=A0A7X7LSZ1_9RHOO|nr:hypothetical protein [Thauera phenolivorans]NLF52832.1 hypothetical protein [Thauera phenolivorans]
MLILRLFALLAVLGIAGSILLWLVTGDPRFKAWAWRAFRIALVVLFVFLALFALERVLAPLA